MDGLNRSFASVFMLTSHIYYDKILWLVCFASTRQTNCTRPESPWKRAETSHFIQPRFGLVCSHRLKWTKLNGQLHHSLFELRQMVWKHPYSLLTGDHLSTTGWHSPYPDHVVDGVNVTVTSVHPDGPQREAELLPWAVDDDRLPGAGGAERGVSAWRGVSWGRVWGEGIRRQGAGQRRHPEDIWKNKRWSPPEQTLI